MLRRISGLMMITTLLLGFAATGNVWPEEAQPLDPVVQENPPMDLGIVEPKKESPTTLSPANLSGSDQGDVIPVSLLQGHVSSQPGQYILGPGDTVSLKVEDLKQYNQTFTLRPDGYASIQPFGQYYMAGIDLANLETWLEEKFRFYLREPQVTLDVKSLRPASIHVSGGVRRPGVYEFARAGDTRRELTLNNVLKAAGGLTLFSDLHHVRVVRGSTGTTKTLDLVEALLKNPAHDIWLVPGDSVEIPVSENPMDPALFRLVSRSMSFAEGFPVIVLGAVEVQGEVQLGSRQNTLNAAIAAAGGFKPAARDRQVIVQRPTNNGQFARIRVNRRQSNFEIMPGDVIYVPNSARGSLKEAFQVLSLLTQPFFFTTAGLKSLDDFAN